MFLFPKSTADMDFLLISFSIESPFHFFKKCKFTPIYYWNGYELDKVIITAGVNF